MGGHALEPREQGSVGEDAQESQVGDIRALYGVTMLGPPG